MNEQRLQALRTSIGGAAPLRRRSAQPLIEALPSERMRSARLNKDARIIANCTLITANSTNGARGKRRYSEQALRQIASMAEGIPAYANHVAPDLAFKPRDVRDLIGRHANVRFDGSRVVSDLHLVEHAAHWVFSLAERLGDHVGLSLVSKGLVRMEGDTEVIDEVVAIRSGDLVSDPASTKGLFEARVDAGDIRALAEACQQCEVQQALGDAWTRDAGKDRAGWTQIREYVKQLGGEPVPPYCNAVETGEGRDAVRGRMVAALRHEAVVPTGQGLHARLAEAVVAPARGLDLSAAHATAARALTRRDVPDLTEAHHLAARRLGGPAVGTDLHERLRAALGR